MKTVFRKKNNECFLTSLCNLLGVEFNESELAADVSVNARKNKLIYEDGSVLIGTTPRLVEILTHGLYYGTLHTTTKRIEQMKLYEESSLPKSMLQKEHIQIIDSLYNRGRIVTNPAEVLFPSIIAIPGHAVAACSSGIIIDDGNIRSLNETPYLEEMIVGVIKVSKHQNY